METPKPKMPTYMFETLPSYQDPNRGGPVSPGVRPGHPDPDKGGAIKPFEWKGHLPPQHRFTLEKLSVLEPRIFPAGVMAARDKLGERTPVFVKTVERLGPGGRKVLEPTDEKYARHGKDGLVRYERGQFARTEDGDLIPFEKRNDDEGLAPMQESAPVHEFLAGRKYTTPNFVKSRKEVVGDTTEPLRPETARNFSSALEHYAKSSGNGLGDTHYSTFDLGDRAGTKLAFTWVDEAARSYDALTEKTEMGTFSVITQTSGVPETVQYSVFEGENGLSIHRHAWLTDPDFQSNYMSPPAAIGDLSEEETKQYNQFLAGQIENLHQMKQDVEQGHAVVDDIEASEGLGFIAKAL
jgi:hypothetical protein